MTEEAYKYVRFNTAQETRWATVEELMHSSSRIELAAEEYPAAGLPLMSDGLVAYVDNTDTHSLIFGATGSKKTRLFCMPMINMMAKAGESFVVTDPKGELYAQTSGLVREKGYKTVVLNFRDIGRGDRWNPLSLPYELWHQGRKDEAGLLLADIAAAIAAPIAKNTKDTYWPEAAQQLAIAGLFLLMEAATKEEANMRSFAAISTFGNADQIKELCDYMRKDSVPFINYSATFGHKAQVTSSGVAATLSGMLRLFCLNESLSGMLSETSFDISRIGREKTAVYIIAPDEKTTFHFLITMFIKQVYEVLIGEAQKEKNRQLPVRVNFVLDEFCNIPAVPDMPSMISAARSRNMRFFLIVQSMHQLKGKYGEDADTIKGNCDNWIFLTSRELDLLEEISALCGHILLADGQPRRLISHSELQRLDKQKGEALVMHGRQYPIISSLADISEYKMFGTYPTVEMEDRGGAAYACFTLQKLFADIEALVAVAPFPTEAHKLSQAKKIYKRELFLLRVEDEEEKPPAPRFSLSEFLRRQRGESTEEESPATEEAAAPETEEERKQKEAEEATKKQEREEKIALARKNAEGKIAALLGEEYAKRFFEENLMESSLDEEDGDDF